MNQKKNQIDENLKLVIASTAGAVAYKLVRQFLKKKYKINYQDTDLFRNLIKEALR